MNPRVTQFLQATVGTLVLVAAWQIASYFFPHYLFPPVQAVVARTIGILLNWSELSQVLETAARIFAGLAGAFVLGCLFAIPIGRYPKIESYVMPLLVFLQGIPTMSFRPSGWTLFKVLIVPTIVPGILTAWKINLGNAARVVVVAELVGATGGVGYELLRQQQLFDMAGAIAWTLQLVLFVLVVQQAITAIEAWALRYRAVSERAM
jgi:ABC-type nitrate/sulfonate/bicarbonate transport system permease component